MPEQEIPGSLSVDSTGAVEPMQPAGTLSVTEQVASDPPNRSGWYQDPTFRWNVIASVVASIIFVVFFNPILSAIWGLILRLGGHFFQFLVNSAYRNAALGDRQWVIAGIAMMVLVSLPLVNLTITAMLFFRAKSKKPTLAERLSALPTAEARLTALNEERRVVQKKINKLTVAQVLVSLVLLFFSLSLAMSIGLDLQLNASFEQRLTVLAPNLSDIEYKRFRAAWAQMRSRTDYLAIEADLEARAKMANITLPPSLLP